MSSLSRRSTTGRTRPTIPRRDRLILIADRVDGRPESITHRIRQAFAESNKSELLKLTKELPVADQEPSTLFLLATALRNAGEVQEALRLLRLAHEIRPQDFWVNLELGKTVLYWKPSGQIDALRYFEAALACSGNNPGVYVYIANTHVQQNNLEAAEASFRQAIRLKPDLFVAHIGLGCLLTLRRMLRDGDLVLERAANLQPRSELANFNLGFVLQLQGKFEAAAEAYRRRIAIKPNYVEALNNLGNTLTSLGRLEDALRHSIGPFRCARTTPRLTTTEASRSTCRERPTRPSVAIALRSSSTRRTHWHTSIWPMTYISRKASSRKPRLSSRRACIWFHPVSPTRIGGCGDRGMPAIEPSRSAIERVLARGGLPATAADSCDRAYIASWPHRKLYRLATELYKHAFELDGRLAENLTQGYR